MIHRRYAFASAALLAVFTACGEENVDPAPDLTAYRRGHAITVSRDNALAIAVNRTAGSMSVIDLHLDDDRDKAIHRVTLPIGAEPWSVVLDDSGDTAYVVLRAERKVLRVRNLRTNPAIDAEALTGSEPTSLVITPSGSRLYVANWAEGTLSVVDTASMSVSSTIDLNGVLVASGLLGDAALRPALAHPRAVAITDDGDGDDDDETLYVTEFFSQARTDALPIDDFDVGRQGVVYRIDVATGIPADPILLAPVKNTGFVDSNGQPTGCFPNQLHAAALHGRKLYVTAVCASPRGPVNVVPKDGPVVSPGTRFSNVQTQVHAALFVIDTLSQSELREERALLTERYRDLYDAHALPTESPERLMPLIVQDVGFVPGHEEAYAPSYGSDALFRVKLADQNDLEAERKPFVLLAESQPLPVGVAIAEAAVGALAIVINEGSRSISIVDLESQGTVGTVRTDETPAGNDTAINKGRTAFVTGLTRWSLNGQGWHSCESCHPDGLSDGVTWFFGRGPRQTPPVHSAFDRDTGRRKLLLWTASLDEIHDVEAIARGNNGGVGALVWSFTSPPSNGDRIGWASSDTEHKTERPQNGLNGSSAALMPNDSMVVNCADGAAAEECNSESPEWSEIVEYVRSVRVPRAPISLDADQVRAGRELFRTARCGGCHGGPLWTLSHVFYEPNEANNDPDSGLLVADSTMYQLPLAFPAELNPPAMTTGRSVLRGDANKPDDRILCALRDVGTYGVAPDDAPVLPEVRADMKTAALGVDGFNIPSLFGLAVSAPYFHAGNARTLEELLVHAFERHHAAFAPQFLQEDGDERTRDLVAFLLSIDGEADLESVPVVELGFDPDLCAAIPPGSID